MCLSRPGTARPRYGLHAMAYRAGVDVLPVEWGADLAAGVDHHLGALRWPIDRRNHVQGADLRRIFGQLIAPARAVLGGHHPVACQSLQYLGHQCSRNPVFFRDFIRAASMSVAMRGQMLYGNQTVVCFLGQFEHRSASPPEANSKSHMRLI